MIYFVMLFTLAISWVNCYSCGRSWDLAKKEGWFGKLLVWCGAVQSAIGFSMVVLLVICLGAMSFGSLTPHTTERIFKLFNGAIIIPAITSGFVIVIESWREFIRQKSIGNLAQAAYNSWAEYSNVSAASGILGDALDLFTSDDDEPITPLIAVVFGTLLCGIVITYVLINKYRKV